MSLLSLPPECPGQHARDPHGPAERARHVARASLELTPSVPFHINVDVQMEPSEPPRKELPHSGEADAGEGG